MAYPGDTSMVPESALRAEGGDAELADLGRQGPNDFFNGLLEQVHSRCSGGARWGPPTLRRGRTRARVGPDGRTERSKQL